ncbi:threonine aldolase family protein [Gulosibacter molinativorax]|uniref:Threonine aldolase n=1 Tax=Gulosibacter molinativorax TaxID=256821 RepID=A0ABT7C7X2_9MICO|nr:beta-eliminating lyase-related protein [Gulosibacter molinativorax]MDJ1371305.1 threonine aldolase [Gulosibacter molinativorax]QUY63631.1 Beta-eliminating lyase [Gulosibacter molinativorax]
MISSLHDQDSYHFGSDNYAGAHPLVLEAIATANGGHVQGYGDDPYTELLRDSMRELFGERAEVYPVFNGTGANVVALQALTPRWGGVFTAASAHINTDEQAAPERLAGLKVLSTATQDGRLTPEDVSRAATATSPDDPHRAYPHVLSFSNSTEFGTVYSVDQTRALVAAAREHGMRIHLDGSRLANAAAATNASLAELSDGVDVISLGGTKIGAMVAEAIVVREPDAVSGIEIIRKFSMQLASKQRFISAQLLALYDGNLWLENARHANAQAQKLAERLRATLGCEVPLEVEANAVFARLAPGVADAVRATGIKFYDWPALPGVVRLMTAWDTPDHALDRLISEIERASAS